MDIHLPKPLHGWREFAGEVGIIVLGVLIALGAEQIVIYISDRRGAAELRQSMRNELAIDRARWEAVHQDAPCALKTLEALRAWASKPGTDHVDHVREPQLWTMHDSAWQIARSSPKMTVLPLKERNTFADLYFALGVTQRLMDKALDSWTRVAALARVADRPSNRDSIPAAAAEAEVAITNYDRGHFDYLEQRFDGLGIHANLAALLPRPANYETGCPKIQPVTSPGA